MKSLHCIAKIFKPKRYSFSQIIFINSNFSFRVRRDQYDQRSWVSSWITQISTCRNRDQIFLNKNYFFIWIRAPKSISLFNSIVSKYSSLTKFIGYTHCDETCIEQQEINDEVVSIFYKSSAFSRILYVHLHMKKELNLVSCFI